MMHAARYERMFPGEGGIDLVSLTRAMPADIAVSIEVPTAELAKTVDAKARAQRALGAARNVMAAAGNKPWSGMTFLESSSRSISLFEHDLRANASRLSRGKTGANFFRIML
jgi:hypothetical protein